MTFKDQLNKLKDNWLLVLVVVVFLGFFLFSSGVSKYGGVSEQFRGAPAYAEVAVEKAFYPSPRVSGDFAPEVEERLKTTSASLSTEVARGTFSAAQKKLKSIVSASDALLLNENVNRRGTDRHPYRVGSYTIKVESDKYDAVISQLKDIGEVTSFNENVQDITGQYVDLQGDLEGEKERLNRYEAMYEEARDIEDKITLSDRIFNQERTIKYLEDRIKNLGNRVSYSTVSVTITEKQSGYASVLFVKFSELVSGLVGSINALLGFIFVILPWVIAYYVLKWLIKLTKRLKK